MVKSPAFVTNLPKRYRPAVHSVYCIYQFHNRQGLVIIVFQKYLFLSFVYRFYLSLSRLDDNLSVKYNSIKSYQLCVHYLFIFLQLK